MPLDYSKWDALELSDDSDIEVHPNVDKKSFIRAKQAQIHQERAHRKQQIETLKYERIINDGLLTRIDGLLNALKAHSSSTSNPDQLVFQALIESADPENDQPPAPPAGVHTNVQDQPAYSKMMAALVDQVRKKVDETKGADRMAGYVSEIGEHKDHVLDLQQQLLKKLAELEKLEKTKITSEGIHTGFDITQVHKPAPAPAPTPSSSSTVELLNSPKSSPSTISAPDSGAEADIEDAASAPSIHASTHHCTALGTAFGKITSSDYRASLQYISQNPTVLAERETDGLLLQAFDAQIAAKPNVARNCVHQALLLQYCRALGKDGVAMFFKRITTKDHNARTVFLDDVNATHARLRDRAVEMKAEEDAAEAEEGAGGVEQIQLHAVNPGQKIMISIPAANDADVKEERAVFESFPPGLQRALESGSLDEVNKVLGKMSVDEAEEVVDKLGGTGMLSMEEGVIDATTEEGLQRVQEIEKEAKMGRERDGNVMDDAQDVDTREPELQAEPPQTLAVDEID